MRRLQAVVVLVVVGLAVAGLAIAGQNNNSSIHLNGDFEVPIRDTNAQGQAIFHIADDGSSVDYKLIGANIENVFQAHIHCGAPGATGQIVVWLYPSTATTPGPTNQGRVDGVLAEGTFTDANVIDRVSCSVDDLADVIALLQNGGAYVNIHTSDGVSPTQGDPDGPAGDWPGGEIRGDTP